MLRRGASAGQWVAVVVGDRVELSNATTGKAIYGMRFRRELTGWKIVSAEVEADPRTHQPDRPEQESDRLQLLLERLVT
jgi:thiazole synthase ThiGH ThiG subunit